MKKIFGQVSLSNIHINSLPSSGLLLLPLTLLPLVIEFEQKQKKHFEIHIDKPPPGPLVPDRADQVAPPDTEAEVSDAALALTPFVTPVPQPTAPPTARFPTVPLEL